MSTNDATTPYPMEEPDQVGQLFREVFDLVDETVAGISDAEVDEHLCALLAGTAEPAEPADLDELGRILAGQGWQVSPIDPAKRVHDLAGPGAWDKAQCALQAAWDQMAIVQAAAAAARREAELHTAAAAEARRQAAEVTAGVNAYVDAALDRAESVLAEARAEAARLVAAAQQQAEEIAEAARTRAVPAAVSAVAHAWPKVTFTGRCVLLVGAGATGSGKTALFTAMNTILTVPDADHCTDLADAVRRAAGIWQPSAVLAACGASGAALRDDLVQQVKGLLALTDPAGALPGWTGAAADAYRDRLASCNSPAEELHDALRAIAAAVVPTRLTGSYRRSVQVRYPRYLRQLDVDLGVVFGEPDVLLAAHHGPHDRDRPWERLWTMLSPLGTCAIPAGPTLHVESHGGSEDRPDAPAGIRVVDGTGAARRYLLVQVTHHGDESGLTLRVPVSAPMRSLLVFSACASTVADWPLLDEADLPDSDDRPAVAGPVALEGSCQAPPG